jgi:lactobin A/cerein 7B family class IIb bacteriocin
MKEVETTQETADIRELTTVELEDVSGGISGAAFVYCSAVCGMILRALHLA